MRLARRWLSGLLTIFFHLLYNSLAASYDLVAWTVSLGRWKSWMLSTLAELGGPRVLELGHGPGHLQIAMREKGVKSFGIDLSRQMGSLAIRKLKRAGYLPFLVRARAQNLPFASKTFNQVVATFPTEYISAPKSLKEVHRVLASGGQFIVLPVAWITGKSLPERLMAALFRVTGQAGEWNGQLTKQIAKAGFVVEEQFVDLPGSRILMLKASKAD